MELFQYKAIINRVVDGDTIDVDCDLGFGIWKNKMRVRLLGVDTPEKRTRDLVEKRFGLLATAIVEGFCPEGKEIIIRTVLDNKGKFGRILGTIFVDDLNLNDYLIENRYAVKYEGQSKSLIKEAHLLNYKWLETNGKDILPIT